MLEVTGFDWAGNKNVRGVLGRRPGVLAVDANPVSQTATVTYDPTTTDLTHLRDWVRECGYHSRGSVGAAAHLRPERPRRPTRDRVSAASPHDAMGHGGHGEMSMADMVRDMRNRFLVAVLLSIPILLWSPIGREVIGFETAAAVRSARRRLQPAAVSSGGVLLAWIFFDGAWRALRARTLDMMVLVAVAVGAGWLYSLGVTLTGGGEVFYEAATVLTAFVLLGHWFEMRARGGANDAIRTLLDLAPPQALVVRDGEPVEISTADVVVGDLLLVRPGAKIATDGVVEEGESEVDESMVTGRACRVHKGPGDAVIGATVINVTGTLRVRASRSAPTPRWRRSWRWCSRRRTPRRPVSASRTRPRSGWSWSP